MRRDVLTPGPRPSFAERRHTRAVGGRRARVIGFVALGTGALGVASLASFPRAHATDAQPKAVAINTRFVEVIDHHEFGITLADNPPDGIELQSLTAKVDNGHYTATIGFASPYKIVGPDQVLFLSLRPPTGGRERLALRESGPTFEVAEGNKFVPQPVRTSVTTAGSLVTFDLDPLRLDPTSPDYPKWEIQAHLVVTDGKGSGFHAHTPQVPIAALVGDITPIPLSTFGNPLLSNQPAYFKPPVPLPLELQVSHIASLTDGTISLDLAADPTSLIGTQIAGTDFTVTGQQIGLSLSTSLTDTKPMQLFWSPSGSSAGTTVTGHSLIFSLPTLPPAPIPGQVPLTDFGPIKAVATATPKTCTGSPVTFGVDVTLSKATLSLAHADGDVASGDIDLVTGKGGLKSPGGRVYDIMSIDDQLITGTHTYEGCTYELDLVPTTPFPRLSTGTVPGIVYIQPFSLVTGDGGLGLAAFGPHLLLSDLVPVAPVAPVVSTAAPVASSEAPVVTEQAPVATAAPPVTDVATKVEQPALPPAEVFTKDNGGGNGPLIGGIIGGLAVLGVGGGVALKKVRFKPPKVKTRTDPATGMIWITDDNGRPLRPSFWVLRPDGTWGPPIGQELKMTARAEQIYQGHAEMNSNVTMAQDIDDLEDPLQWFIAKTSYELLNTFSGGTLEDVEQQENLGTWDGVVDSTIIGTWNFGNMASLGISNRIRDNQRAHAAEINQFLDVLDDDNATWDLKADAILGITNHLLDGFEEGSVQALIDLTPRDEINVLRDANATTEQKTKAALTAVSKVATLIALALGVRAGVRGGKGGKGGGKAKSAPKNPELNKAGVRPALPGGGKNPALNQGGVHDALPPGGAKNPALNQGGVHDALPPGGAKNPALNQGGVHDALPPSGDTVSSGGDQTKALAGPGGFNDAPMDAPTSPGQEPGTKLPGPYEADPAHLNDPLDPGRDPVTNEPLTEKTYVEDFDDPDPTSVGNYAKMFQDLEPGLRARAIEVRALEYEKAQAKAITAAERAALDEARAADIHDLRTAPQSFWDAIDDPQTRATLEALRDSMF